MIKVHNDVYNTNLVLLSWFLQHALILRGTPTNDTEYSCDINVVKIV